MYEVGNTLKGYKGWYDYDYRFFGDAKIVKGIAVVAVGFIMMSGGWTVLLVGAITIGVLGTRKAFKNGKSLTEAIEIGTAKGVYSVATAVVGKLPGKVCKALAKTKAYKGISKGIVGVIEGLDNIAGGRINKVGQIGVTVGNKIDNTKIGKTYTKIKTKPKKGSKKKKNLDVMNKIEKEKNLSNFLVEKGKDTAVGEVIEYGYTKIPDIDTGHEYFDEAANELLEDFNVRFGKELV